MSEGLTDPALPILGMVQKALLMVFGPDTSSPPIGGSTTTVFTFAWEGAPTDAFMPQGECQDQIFVWQRLARRYRVGNAFPAVFSGDFMTCTPGSAIDIEFGVARCADAEAVPGESDLDQEALVGLDDSWRVNLAACTAGGWIRGAHLGLKIGQEPVTPWGPEGGIMAQLTTLHVQLA